MSKLSERFSNYQEKPQPTPELTPEMLTPPKITKPRPPRKAPEKTEEKEEEKEKFTDIKQWLIDIAQSSEFERLVYLIWKGKVHRGSGEKLRKELGDEYKRRFGDEYKKCMDEIKNGDFKLVPTGTYTDEELNNNNKPKGKENEEGKENGNSN